MFVAFIHTAFDTWVMKENFPRRNVALNTKTIFNMAAVWISDGPEK